jgi:hypothetical protein
MHLSIVLGDSAMERLSSHPAVGVPFSTVGLAVKARKDTSEKGRPQKDLAAASRLRRNGDQSTANARRRAFDLAGRCFCFGRSFSILFPRDDSPPIHSFPHR